MHPLIPDEEFFQKNKQAVAELAGTSTFRMITIKRSFADPDAAKNLAYGIHKKANQGADFAEIAKVFSHDSKSSEGGLWKELKRGVLEPALDEALQTLKAEETSDVIETPTGYYLIQLIERHPGKAESLDTPEVKEAATMLLNEQRRQEWKKQYLEKLLKKIADEQ